MTINLPKLANGRPVDADELQAYFDSIKTALDGGITTENMKARYVHVPYTFTWSMDDDVPTAGAVTDAANPPLAETRFKLPTVDGVVTIKDIMLSGSYHDATPTGNFGYLKANIDSDSVASFSGATSVSELTITDPGIVGPAVDSTVDYLSHVITAADNYMRVLITPEHPAYWKNVTVSFNLVYTVQE